MAASLRGVGAARPQQGAPRAPAVCATPAPRPPPPARRGRAAMAETKWAEGSAAAPTSAGAAALHGVGIYINSNFDSGNVEVLRVSGRRERGVTHEVDLQIHADPYCESDGRAHYGWWYFRVSGARGERLQMRLVNAGGASFPEGWKGYRAVASYDRKTWFRVPTAYDEAEGVLTIDYTPTRDAIYFSYWAPYSFGRHQSLVAELQAMEGVSLEMLGETLDGHDLDLLRVGDPSRTSPSGARLPCIWLVARQHPGEAMAEYFAEGFLRRLLDPADAVGRAARARATFFVVPCANPDGAWRGHLRVNAAGANLNREWANPSPDTAPEVCMLLQYMREVGVDAMFDIHGDEAIPAVFAAGSEGVVGWTEGREGLQERFLGALADACPEFSRDVGYGRTPPGKANPAICKNAVAAEFGCLSLTLEMPFKDAAVAPDKAVGWSPERALHFGKDFLGAVLRVLPHLRA